MLRAISSSAAFQHCIDEVRCPPTLSRLCIQDEPATAPKNDVRSTIASPVAGMASGVITLAVETLRQTGCANSNITSQPNSVIEAAESA